MYLSSSLFLDLFSMALGGIGTGIILYPATANTYNWFSEHIGIIVGIMETMISLGSFFFSLFGENIINKYEVQSDDIDNLYSSISIESISKAPISDVHVYLTEDGNYIKPEWKCDLSETSKLIMDSELCRKELIGVDVSYTYIVFFLNSNGLGIPMIIASQDQGASIENYIKYYGDHGNIEYTKITDEETRFNIIQQYMCEDNLSSRLGLDIDNIVEFYESEEEIDIEDNIVSYYI